MLKQDKIIKVEVTTASGTIIISANDKQFTIPNTVGDDGLVENVLMIKGRNLPEIDAGSTVFVITYLRSGDRVRYPGRVKLSSEFQFNVQLRMGAQTIMEERRRFFKVEADTPCAISFITRGDEIIRFTAPIKGTIKNFNIGGVFICSIPEELQKDDTLMLILKLLDERVEISTQVLRVQRNPAGDITGYGCRFLNVDKKQEEIFARFVNQVQLEMRRKQRVNEMMAEELNKRRYK